MNCAEELQETIIEAAIEFDQFLIVRPASGSGPTDQYRRNQIRQQLSVKPLYEFDGILYLTDLRRQNDGGYSRLIWALQEDDPSSVWMDRSDVQTSGARAEVLARFDSAEGKARTEAFKDLLDKYVAAYALDI